MAHGEAPRMPPNGSTARPNRRGAFGAALGVPADQIGLGMQHRGHVSSRKRKRVVGSLPEIGMEDLSELVSLLGSDDEGDARIVLGGVGSHEIPVAPQRTASSGSIMRRAQPFHLCTAFDSVKGGDRKLKLVSSARAAASAAPTALQKSKSRQMRKNERERQRREEVNASFENLSTILDLTNTSRARYDRVDILSQASAEITRLRAVVARASQEIINLRMYKRSAEAHAAHAKQMSQIVSC